jgi:hypothetical protein
MIEMPGQIALITAAYKNNLIGRFVKVSYECSKTKQPKERFGKVYDIGNGPLGHHIKLDTPEGIRTLPLENMETSARFITEEAFRTMFPTWQEYKPKS